MRALSTIVEEKMEYTDFINFLFPRSDDHLEWYFDPHFVAPKISADIAVLYSTKFFTEADTYADRFSEQQFCLALNYLINPACSDHSYYYLDDSVPEPNKLAVLASMINVFSLVFSRRCSDTLSHKAATLPQSYNNVCYMWWDVFPRHGTPAKQQLKTIDRAILETLSKLLLLESIACKESALHGLGHWHIGYPEFVEDAIKQCVSKLPKELVKYAEDARIGNIQ
jgi:hypothetical protein